jgi:hypothetical protein
MKRVERRTVYRHFETSRCPGVLCGQICTRESLLTAPDTISLSGYLAPNEWVTHGESAAVTTSGVDGVCSEAIVTWITRISLSPLPTSLVQVTSRVPHHFVITPPIAELSPRACWITISVTMGTKYLHPLAFRPHPLAVTTVIRIIICITNASRYPACVRFSLVRERRMGDLIHAARL